MGASREQLLEILSLVVDPEIPVLNVVEIGIVRDASFMAGRVHVEITPTYSGCPAMKEIQDDIVAALNSSGFRNVTIETVYAPAWTSDWLTDSAKQKLTSYGIAPPGKASGEVIVLLPTIGRNITCPFCNSNDTELRSEFGSTACKAFHYCNNCKQPFEHFKEI